MQSSLYDTNPGRKQAHQLQVEGLLLFWNIAVMEHWSFGRRISGWTLTTDLRKTYPVHGKPNHGIWL